MRIFLLASFPSLSPREPAPLSSAEVLSRCADHLPAADIAELEALLRDPVTGNSSFARAWAAFRAQRQERNRFERASRLAPPGAAVLPPPRPDDLYWDRIQTAAWDAPDPLAREDALLREDWDWLDEARRADPYGHADLGGYLLQIRLLERRGAWDADAGARAFAEQADAVFSTLLEHLQETEVSA
jgi:hypothetical protein